MIGNLMIGSLLMSSGIGLLVPCDTSFDVMLLQDATLSLAGAMENIFPQIRDLVEFGNELNPDGRFALSTFRDKPIAPVGEKEDYCFKIVVPFTSNYTVLEHAYEVLEAGGGGDPRQGHYQGLLESLQLLRCQWRPIGTGPGEIGVRIVVIVTDAIAHDADEIIEGFPDLPDNDGIVSQDNTAIDCDFKGYPTIDQVLATVKGSENQFVGIVTTNQSPDVAKFWSAVNEDVLNQPSVFYQFMNKDGSGFKEAVLNIVRGVQHYVCGANFESTEPFDESTESLPMSATSALDSTTTTTTTTTTVPSASTHLTAPYSPAADTTVIPTSATISTHSVSTTPDRCPQPCPCPHPCPHSCCKDEVVLKVAGHPVHVDMEIEYEEKH